MFKGGNGVKSSFWALEYPSDDNTRASNNCDRYIGRHSPFTNRETVLSFDSGKWAEIFTEDFKVGHILQIRCA